MTSDREYQDLRRGLYFVRIKDWDWFTIPLGLGPTAPVPILTDVRVGFNWVKKVEYHNE